jgi:hypothetical protein
MNKIFIKKDDIEISLEGDSKFIEKHLSKLNASLGLFDEQAKTAMKVAGKNLTTESKTKGGGTLRDIYEAKKPSTHYDKIAVFGYHLSEQGKSSFTKDEIKDCYLEMRLVTKMPGNLIITLQDTIKNTGYIKRVGKGNFELTSGGMNHVLHDLPSDAKK